MTERRQKYWCPMCNSFYNKIYVKERINCVCGKILKKVYRMKSDQSQLSLYKPSRLK